MCSLLQNREIPLVSGGLLSGPRLFVILLGVVVVLIIILVGIIAAEIISKVKKNRGVPESDETDENVDDEWVKDVVQEITAYEGEKAAEAVGNADKNEKTQETAAEEQNTQNNKITSRTNRHAAISLRNVTVEVSREGDDTGRVKKIFDKMTPKEQGSNKFVALENVSFDVNRGEILGIVGTDGSGKRTLLKLINGEFEPSVGDVAVNSGDVHMLTLGNRMDEEMSGRKYLYKCAEEAGYTKSYVDENYSKIVEYSELGDYIDDKTGNYSIGMISRLKIALTAADDNPGVLIIDELLSVCDMFFRKKCESRIRSIAQNGSAILIVSNVMNFVARNCTKAMWIEKGALRMVGEPEKVCSAYIHMQYPD